VPSEYALSHSPGKILDIKILAYKGFISDPYFSQAAHMNRSNSILEPRRKHAFRQRLVSLVSLFFFASLSPAVETSSLQAQTTTLPEQQDLEKTVEETKKR
jgi:hypothetical protein